MSRRCLQNFISVTIFSPRRLQDTLKMSWKTKNCYPENVFKICLEDILETSKIFTGKQYMSVSNKS